MQTKFPAYAAPGVAGEILTVNNMKHLVKMHIDSKLGSKKVSGEVTDTHAENEHKNKDPAYESVYATVLWDTNDESIVKLTGPGRNEPWTFPGKQLPLVVRAGFNALSQQYGSSLPATHRLDEDVMVPFLVAPYTDTLGNAALKKALG